MVLAIECKSLSDEFYGARLFFSHHTKRLKQRAFASKIKKIYPVKSYVLFATKSSLSLNEDTYMCWAKTSHS